MRLLITGGCGFIGSDFIRMMLARHEDWKIINLDALTYAGNERNLAEVSDCARHTLVRGDIRDARAVRQAIGDGVDVIVNFAAETHVDRSIMGSADFIGTNVEGVRVLLDAVRDLQIPRFVHVSTDEVYGSIATGRSAEEAVLAPSSPYAASKASADLLVLAYVRTYGVPALITRGSNTYGPYQHPEKLVPLFVTNLLDAKPVPLYGDGHNVREWLYVDDHCSAIEEVLLHGSAGAIYNIGPDAGCANTEIAHRLCDLLGAHPAEFIRTVPDRPGHDSRYALDSSKLRALGWSPTIDLIAGLERTVRWYREREDWWRPIVAGEFSEFYRRQYSSPGAP